MFFFQIGEKYCEVVGEDFDVVIVRFFGIFFFFLQSSQVWGNLISSAVLSVGVNNFTRSEEFLEKCGANFCPSFELGQTNVTSVEASDHQFKIYLMTSIYLGLAWCSVAFVAVFVSPLSSFYSYGIGLNPPKNKNVELLFATFKQMKKPYQILITPLTIWSGIEQGFLSADYTAAFVSCGIGIHMVGYSFLCYGVSDAICTLAFTPLIQYVKRVPIFTFGALLNVALLILMFAWKPDPEDYFVFFLIPALWGMSDAIWQTQINAYYGVLFPKNTEAAFSNYRLWEAAGYILAYIISSFLCMRAKMYVNLLSLGLGMAGFYTIEVMEKRK
ncbi:UNVERIFIED_CONTAM: hypothetical protein GTU68_025280 [Idotea baltica]|nr:hypothetical protein [Idotea baltica]